MDANVAARMARTAIVLALIAASVIAAALPLHAQDDVIERVLAVVGDQIITQADVRAASELGLVEASPGADPIGTVLEKLVDRELELAEVQRYEPPDPPETAIETRIAAIRARFPTPAAFEAALSHGSLDLDRLRVFVKDDFRIAAYLDERFVSAAQPTDDEVDVYLREHRSELVRDGRSLDEARDAARQRLMTDRRQALVTDWLAGLRRRTEIIELYLPPSSPPANQASRISPGGSTSA